MNRRIPLSVGALAIGLVLTGCGSGSSSPTTSAASSPTTNVSTSTVPPGSSTTTVTATAAAATCPTLAQAEAALGGSYSGPIQTPTPGGGIVCEFTGGAGGNAGVTIFAHQSATVFAGQMAHASGAPDMPPISGVGDGGFGMTSAAGRSIVNAYSTGSRTLVAAQANGSLASVEALARVALADN